MTDLLQEFFQEIDRNLSQVSRGLDRWERAPDDLDALNAVFRVVHNVKAACHVLGFRRIEALAHAAEDLLYAIREGSAPASPEAVATVREAVARIETLVEGLRADKAEPLGEDNELLLVISCLAAPAEARPAAAQEEPTGFPVEAEDAAGEAAELSPQDGHVLPGLDEITEAGLFPETDATFAHLPDIARSPAAASGAPAASAEARTLRDIAPPAPLAEAVPGDGLADGLADGPGASGDEAAALGIAAAGPSDLPPLPLGPPEGSAPTPDEELDAIAAEIMTPSAQEPPAPPPEAEGGAGLPSEPALTPGPTEAVPAGEPLPETDAAPGMPAAELPDPPPLAASADLGPSRVSIGCLHPDPEQPRQRMDEEALRSLSDSIAAHGVLQPILVRPHAELSGQYQIVAGERRWRAAALAGLEEVPVSLRDLGDEAALQLSLVENLQRQDLTPIEEAEGYQQLISRFALTQEAAAERVGKSRSHVANSLRLLALPPAVKEMLHRGALTAGHARALLSFAEPEPVAREVVEKGLSVRATEELARQPAAREPAALELEAGTAKAAAVGDELKVLERELAVQLGAKVKIRLSGEAGEIRLRFDSLADLEALVGRLRRVPQSSAA